MRLVTIAGIIIACCSVPAAATEWPNGTKAVVVLTYDDALKSQLDNAVPALDRAKFKATFFLSNIKREDISRWRELGRRGYELANHTLFHPCAAATYPSDPRYTLERYTPASALKEIEQENVLLTAIDGKAQHGFGTPCGQTMAGGKDYLEPLRAAKLVIYARSKEADDGDAYVDVSTMDMMRIPARSFPDTVTGTQLIDFAKSAEAGRGMAVFVFHGVGGDYLRVSIAAHIQLLRWLQANRRDVWVTTLDQAVTWAQHHPS